MKAADADRSLFTAYDSFVVKHGRRPVAMLLHPDTLAQWEKREITFPDDIEPVAIMPADFVTRGQVWMPISVDGAATTFEQWQHLMTEGNDAGEIAAKDGQGETDPEKDASPGKKSRPARKAKAATPEAK